jgi:hypothetical protein
MADVRGEGGNQDTTEILRYAQNDRLQYRATEPRGDNLETTFRLGPVRRTQGRPFDVAPFGKLRVNRAGRRRYKPSGGERVSEGDKCAGLRGAIVVGSGRFFEMGMVNGKWLMGGEDGSWKMVDGRGGGRESGYDRDSSLRSE